MAALTTDDVVNLICIALGNSDANTKAAIQAAIKTAVGVVVARGGSGWDFTMEDFSLTTEANRTAYVITKPSGADATNDAITISLSKPLGVIHEVWYQDGRLRKFDRSEFMDEFQGNTRSGEPEAWTAYGNTFKIGPIPGSGYDLAIVASVKPSTLEDIDEANQFAVVYTAIGLMFKPGSNDYLKAKDQMQVAIDALMGSDGHMDFADRVKGSFG